MSFVNDRAGSVVADVLVLDVLCIGLALVASGLLAGVLEAVSVRVLMPSCRP
jgi:hypothetical protein